MTWFVLQTGQETNSFSPIASNSKFALHCGQVNSIDAKYVLFIVFPPNFEFSIQLSVLTVVVSNYIETAYLYLLIYYKFTKLRY